jgi:bacteriocin biosynthesis cyclodehydratase domain-containing protein
VDRLMEIRPKLRRDSLFLQTQDGVFLQSDNAMFSLKGKNIYRLLATLSPYLNGKYTLDELCQELGAAQQTTVTRLVQTLLQRGILQESVPEDPGLLAASVSEHFHAQIEFIEHYQDHPLQRFKTFRESRILLIGSGDAFLALATSLLQNGVRELFLASQHEPEAHRRALEAEAEELRQSGVEILLTRIDADRHSAAFTQHLATCDIAVYCADMSSSRTILELQQDCRKAGCTFLPVVFMPGQIVLGPLVETTGPCWLCAQTRLAANADGDRRAAIWQALALDTDGSTQDTAFFPALARRVGNALGFEIFKKRTGALPSELVNSVICQDSETVEAHQASLSPYPLCPLCSQMTPALWEERTLDIVTERRDRAFSVDEFINRSNELIHQALGILHGYEDDRLTQIPLKVSRIRASSPATPASRPIRVTAFHTGSTLDARIIALKETLQQYMSSLPDSRSMPVASRSELEMQGTTALAAPSFSMWSGTPPLAGEERCEWLPAFSLAQQKICSVPAAAVYPFSFLNRRYLFEKTSAGLATNTTFADVLLSGLCSALAYEAVQEYVHRHCPVIKLEPEALEEVDTDLTFLLHSLKHFARPFTLLEVVTSVPVHIVVGFFTDTGEQQHARIGSGFSGIQAAKMALLHLVGCLQVLNDEGSDSHPDALFFPDFTPGIDPDFAPRESSRLLEPAATLQTLKDALFAQGRDILFVNTTTSDIWNSETLISGKVLLTRSLKQDR